MTYAELTARSARTLGEWCDKPHPGYGARIDGDELVVWVGRSSRAITTIPMKNLVCWWRNRVADVLRTLKQSLLED